MDIRPSPKTDILVVIVCLQLIISLPRIKLVASNFAWWFIGVLGRESHILGNFAPPGAPNRTNCSAHGLASATSQHTWPVHWPIHPAHRPRVVSACVDIKTDALVLFYLIFVAIVQAIATKSGKMNQTDTSKFEFFKSKMTNNRY